MSTENDSPAQASASASLKTPFVRLYPILVDITEDLNAGLLLSAAYRIQLAHGDEWFACSAEEWRQRTRLSQKQQVAAREKLKTLVVRVNGEKRHIWQEQLKAIPAKLHFRVDVAALVATVNRTTTEHDLSEREEI